MCQNATFTSKLRETVIHLPVSQHAIRNWSLLSAERRIKAAYLACLALTNTQLITRADPDLGSITLVIFV